MASSAINASRGLTFDRLASAAWVVPGIIALALVLRLALMLLLPLTPFSDSAWYVARAGEIASGVGYQEAGHPTAFWPVGWPALLAGAIRLFGSAALASAMVNLVATAAMLLLIGWFVRVAGGSRGAARVAMLLYAIYPSPIIYAGAALSETSSTAVAMAAFALLVAGRHRLWLLGLSGLLFGAATLMRAQMLMFPIGAVIALMLVFRDMRWRDAAKALLVVYLALAAVVLPWSLRNERALGSFVLVSTNGGVTMYTGANDQATGAYFRLEDTPLWNKAGVPFAQRVERQVELDRNFKTLAREWIAAHPLRWSAIGFNKVALLWYKDTDAFWALDESYPALHSAWRVGQVADQLLYMLLLALAVWPLFVGGRAVIRRDWPRAPLALLGCMPAFVTLTAFGFTGQIRFHFPAMPFIAAAAGIALADWWQRRARAGSALGVSPPSGSDPRAA